MIMSAGTGGTISGTAKKLKAKIPGVQIVAVDPYGSILAEPDGLSDSLMRTGQGRLTAYQVEGIGHDLIPTALGRQVADHWVKTDEDGASRRCVRSCGTGTSSARTQPGPSKPTTSPRRRRVAQSSSCSWACEPEPADGLRAIPRRRRLQRLGPRRHPAAARPERQTFLLEGANSSLRADPLLARQRAAAGPARGAPPRRQAVGIAEVLVQAVDDQDEDCGSFSMLPLSHALRPPPVTCNDCPCMSVSFRSPR